MRREVTREELRGYLTSNFNPPICNARQWRKGREYVCLKFHRRTLSHRWYPIKEGEEK